MFWQNYVKLCNEKGEAPNAVAAKCGVKSSGTVTGWKNGSMPRAGALQRLADYFGVSKEELLGNEKSPATKRDETNSNSALVELLKVSQGLTEQEAEFFLPQVLGVISARKTQDSH